MAEENQAGEEGKAAEGATAVLEGQEGQEPQAEKKEKLNQTVELADTGPCKKHIKVTVSRGDIDKLLDEKYKELVSDAQVPGFRPGKAPRKIVIRKFRKDVVEQVRGQVLLASLEQLAEDFDVAPLSPPEINPDKLDIPEEGDFVYEFDVEVRPQFDLPNYKGLKLKRPIKQFTDDDVANESQRILARYGQLVPKPEGKAQIGDYLICDMTSRLGDKVIGTAKETTIRIDDKIAFKDGVAEKFGEQTVGASAGDTKVVEITLTEAVAAEQLKGQKVQTTLEVKDVKKLRLPELTEDFLENMFQVKTPDQFREKIRVYLEGRLAYQQRQSAREQVLEHIAASATWELPQDLLIRQARKAFARRLMEMREAGLSDDEIKSRQRVLEQNVLQSTAASLKEHFVLQKIAEVEKIEVDDDAIEMEIERIADQTNESPRRVRAQLEKEEMLDTLAAQLIERMALDLILDSAEYEDVALEKEAGMGNVEQQTVEGEMRDPTQAPPEEKKEGEPS